MKNTKQFTKRQHYIPQFYLKNFSHDEEHLYIYDKKGGNEETIRYQTTQKIAHQNNFYTYRSTKGGKENLEDFFQMFEGDAATIIRKLESADNISKEDKERLALFISFIYSRTPAFKKRTEKTHSIMGEKLSRKMIEMTPNETFKKILREKEGKEISDKEIEETKEFARDPKRSRIEFTYPNEYWIKIMLELSAQLAPGFFYMDWLFLKTKQPYAFITSDNPFLLIPPTRRTLFGGYGLYTPGARKVVPLRPNLCLLMGDIKEEPRVLFGETNKDFFRQVNEHLILECDRFAFSSDKGKLEKLIKTTKPHKNSYSDKIVFDI